MRTQVIDQDQRSPAQKSRGREYDRRIVASAIGAGSECPLLPIAFRRSNSSTFETKIGAPAIVASGTDLLSLVPAAQELLRCLLVAPLHVAHKRNMLVVLFAVTERTRLPSLLE